MGLPLYKSTEHIAKALDCLQRQTFGNFEALISVDGGDEETAAACRPFLNDPRFRMVVQSDRLDWFGNFNWLLQQNLQEFFCYRQHDDTTAPQFFEVLLQAADREPEAAAIYCDCQWIGGRSDVDLAPSIEGEPLDRMLQFVERLPPVPVRGLIRRAAIRQAGLINHDEFRALSALTSWLAKLVRWGNFRRVAEPLYYRLDHALNFHKEWYDWPDERKRAAWTGDACELGDHELRPPDVMKRAKGAGEIERGGVELQAGRIAFDEPGVGGRALPCELEQLRNLIDTNDVMYERGQCKREGAGTAADVDRVFAAVGTDECLHALREGLGSRVLVRGDLLRGTRKAVLSHRRRCAARVGDRSRCQRRARR